MLSWVSPFNLPEVTRPPPGRGIRKATRGGPTISSPPGDLGHSSGSFDILRTSGDPHSRGRGGIKSKELAGQGHGSSLTSCALRSAPAANPEFLRRRGLWYSHVETTDGASFPDRSSACS